jgi:hypothetical protein
MAGYRGTASDDQMEKPWRSQCSTTRAIRANRGGTGHASATKSETLDAVVDRLLADVDGPRPSTVLREVAVQLMALLR